MELMEMDQAVRVATVLEGMVVVELMVPAEAVPVVQQEEQEQVELQEELQELVVVPVLGTEMGERQLGPHFCLH